MKGASKVTENWSKEEQLEVDRATITIDDVIQPMSMMMLSPEQG